jgi:hypothetical protein
MRFGTWNVRSLYRAGSLMAAARELARYKLKRRGISWLAAKTGQLLKKDSAPWSK